MFSQLPSIVKITCINRILNYLNFEKLFAFRVPSSTAFEYSGNAVVSV